MPTIKEHIESVMTLYNLMMAKEPDEEIDLNGFEFFKKSKKSVLTFIVHHHLLYHHTDRCISVHVADRKAKPV